MRSSPEITAIHWRLICFFEVCNDSLALTAIKNKTRWKLTIAHRPRFLVESQIRAKGGRDLWTPSQTFVSTLKQPSVKNKQAFIRGHSSGKTAFCMQCCFSGMKFQMLGMWSINFLTAALQDPLLGRFITVCGRRRLFFNHQSHKAFKWVHI